MLVGGKNIAARAFRVEKVYVSVLHADNEVHIKETLFATLPLVVFETIGLVLAEISDFRQYYNMLGGGQWRLMWREPYIMAASAANSIRLPNRRAYVDNDSIM